MDASGLFGWGKAVDAQVVDRDFARAGAEKGSGAGHGEKVKQAHQETLSDVRR
jgi:hypothetical protein